MRSFGWDVKIFSENFIYIIVMGIKVLEKFVKFIQMNNFVYTFS